MVRERGRPDRRKRLAGFDKRRASVSNNGDPVITHETLPFSRSCVTTTCSAVVQLVLQRVAEREDICFGRAVHAVEDLGRDIPDRARCPPCGSEGRYDRRRG